MAKKTTSGVLPVLANAPRKGPLGLTVGQWRAVVLILLHVLIVAHIWHFVAAGRTISPLEPSETAETLRDGLINAGAVFFLLTILSTLVLGRWFCGWGCHVVALQDLARWLLTKVGIKPRPVRSRLLLFVPLFAAAWLFGQPALRSLFGGLEHPVELGLTTDNFWRTFPGVEITILTLFVGGFLIIYVLGAKGFCTYACPYGALFVLADRFSPGRIRVTEDCSACGVCTQVCTSNVLVAKEVIEHGKVVDPGCMKCMDCVTHCPTNALYFGFKSQSQGKQGGGGKKKAKSAGRFEFTWAEEIFLAGLFLVSFAVYYDLYGRVPFLLALGLGSITAYLGAVAMRFFERREVRFQNLVLRREGRLTGAGRAYAAVMMALVVVLLHGAFLQWQFRQGKGAFDAAAAAPPTQREALAAAAQVSLERVARWGIVDTRGVGRMLGQIHLWNGEPEAAVEDLRREVASGSRNPAVSLKLGQTLTALGRPQEARAVYRATLSETWTSPAMYLSLAQRFGAEDLAEPRLFLLDGGLARHPEDPALVAAFCAEAEAADALRDDSEVQARRSQVCSG
jgi:NAD-dependent dihydropyrimidine dehydrogenase PreA subunit